MINKITRENLIIVAKATSNILCKKLVQEQLYTSASIILSPRSAVSTGDYSELSEMASLKAFISTLAGHAAAEASRIYG